MTEVERKQDRRIKQIAALNLTELVALIIVVLDHIPAC